MSWTTESQVMSVVFFRGTQCSSHIANDFVKHCDAAAVRPRPLAEVVWAKDSNDPFLLLSISIGSVDEWFDPVCAKLEPLREFGVEAAVLDSLSEPDEPDEPDEPVLPVLDTVGVMELVVSGRLVEVIQGWFNRSRRLGRSPGRILRHFLIMSWHSCERRALNLTSALQIASSFS